MKSDMAGAAAVGATMLAVAALKPDVAVTAYLPMAENMPSGYGVPAGRRDHHVQRQAGRGAQHRRRGPDGARRRDRPGLRGRHRLPVRDVHADRRAGDRAGQADRRRDGHRRRPASGSRRPATRSASRPGRCRCPTTCARAWTPTWPTSARSTRTWTGPGTCCRAACSCASSSPTACDWAHIDIAGPSYHTGEPTGYWTKGGTGRAGPHPARPDRGRRRQRLNAGLQTGAQPGALLRAR